MCRTSKRLPPRCCPHSPPGCTCSCFRSTRAGSLRFRENAQEIQAEAPLQTCFRFMRDVRIGRLNHFFAVRKSTAVMAFATCGVSCHNTVSHCHKVKHKVNQICNEDKKTVFQQRVFLATSSAFCDQSYIVTLDTRQNVVSQSSGKRRPAHF